MRVIGYILAIVLLPLLLAFTTVDSPQSTTADGVQHDVADSLRRTYRHTDAIQHLTIKGDTLAARNIWLEIVEQDSTYSPALYYLSRIERNRERGLDYARRAYLGDSTNKWYTEHLANSLISNLRYREALPIYRRLIRLDPHAIQAYHALALLYHSGGMPYSAIAILDSAELRLGYNSYLAGIKQNLLIDTRQYDKAIAEGIRITEEHPYDIDALTSLAVAYEASGKDSLALRSYEQAFRIDSTNIRTIEAIIEYYRRAGNAQRMLDYEERLFRDKRIAVEDKINRLERYTSNRSFYGDNFFRIGSIIMRLTMDYPTERAFTNAYSMHLINGGFTNEAYEYMMRHIDDESTTEEDYMLLLQYMLYLQSSDEDILTIVDKASLRFPFSEDIISFKGFFYSENEQYDEAIKVFKKALRSARKQKDNKLISKWLGYIGDIYHSQGNDMKAFMAYADALHYDGDNIPVLNNYAYFLSLTGRGLDKALEMATRAIQLEKGNATYIDTYAWILHRLGRNEEAKQAMRQALSINGQRDPDLLAHYGDILWALGEKFMAETYWKKAVDMGYDATKMQQHIAEIKQQ